MAVLHHLQDQSRRHRERGDQRDIDAAPDHDDRHREPENAEHRHVLQQRQHVRGRQEAREGDREDREQHRENREYDSLLANFLISIPDALLRSLPAMFARFRSLMQAVTMNLRSRHRRVRRQNLC